MRLIRVVTFQAGQLERGFQQGHTTARDDAFFHRSAGGVQGVVDAVFLLFHFDLGGTANLDHGHTAGQLGQTFLQLFAIVIGRGVFSLLADLRDAGFDLGLVTHTVDDRGVVLGDVDALGRAQHVERDGFQLDAEIFGDDLATGQDGDVFQHGLAAVAEARSLHGGNLQATAQLVDHEGGQRFAFDVFRDDQQRTAGLHDGFQDREHRLQGGQLLLEQQDVGLFQLGLHLVRIGDEVRGQVATVELHAFDDIQLGFEGFGFLDRDDAFLADLVHGLGDHFANVAGAVGGDGADLGDFTAVLDRGGDGLDVLDDQGDGLVDAALQVHRVHAGGHRLHAFAHDGLGQNRGGRGAVAGDVVRLGRDFAQHLCAHVLELVGQFDFLGDGNAVLRGARGAEGFLDHDIAAFRAQRDFHSVGEDVDAAQHALAGVRTEIYVFSSHGIVSVVLS